jgi:hypothetical protein
MAKAKPLVARYMNEIGDFAESIGVKFNGADIARQVDPRIETKIQQIERGDFGIAEQVSQIATEDAKLAGIRGLLGVIRQKFAPNAAAMLEGPESVTKLVSKEVEPTPFGNRVLTPRREINFFNAIQENERMALRQNAIRGRELAGDLRFDENQMVQAVEEIFETAFPRFKELRAAGASDAQILNELRSIESGEFGKLVALWKKFKAYTTPTPIDNIIPGQGLRQPSDFRFVDTEFEAIAPERFQSRVVQEQLYVMRHPIEPPGERFAFMEPDFTKPHPTYYDPSTGKTLTGRGDLPEREYFVLGGPRGQPGAEMTQIGVPVYGDKGFTSQRLPGGPSGALIESGDQIQPSLFGEAVGSAGGPQGVETSAKRFMGPRTGGRPSRGLSFAEINDLTESAQQAAEALDKEGVSMYGGVAKRLASAFRNFEDDSLFKLGVVRGDEGFAEKVLADKRRFANNEKAFSEFGKIFDKNSADWAGSILKLKPEETAELWNLLNPSQKEQLKGLILDKTYNDSVYSLLESGINTKIKPEKIVKNILNSKESRDNIKIIFGDEMLSDLDKLAKVAEFANATGKYAATEKEITKAISRTIARLPQGARVGDFFGALFMGNPTAEQVINTTVKNWENLIRQPSGGIVGKLGKGVKAFETATGLPGRAAVSTSVKLMPQIKNMATRKEKQEMPFGEME